MIEWISGNTTDAAEELLGGKKKTQLSNYLQNVYVKITSNSIFFKSW